MPCQESGEASYLHAHSPGIFSKELCRHSEARQRPVEIQPCTATWFVRQRPRGSQIHTCRVSRFGLATDSHVVLHDLDVDKHTTYSRNLIDLHYHDMPIQLLKSAVGDSACDRVRLASSRERTILHDLPLTDVSTYTAALLPTAPDNEHRNNIINTVATLSPVGQMALHLLSAADSDRCVFCRQCPSSVHHCVLALLVSIALSNTKRMR